MLAKEYNFNFLSLFNTSIMQAEVFQRPAANKHKKVIANSSEGLMREIKLYKSPFRALKLLLVSSIFVALGLLCLKTGNLDSLLRYFLFRTWFPNRAFPSDR
jgi:hypothetical protein